MMIASIEPLVLILLLLLPCIIISGYIITKPVLGLIIICFMLPFESLIGKIPGPLYPMLGAVILFGYIVNIGQADNRVAAKENYLDFVIFLLFVCWMILWNPLAAWKYESPSGEKFSWTLTYIQLAVIYYLSSRLLRANYLSWLAVALMLGTTFSAIYELTKVGFGLGLFTGFFRLKGAFGDPNGFATLALCNVALLPTARKLFRNNWQVMLINLVGIFQIIIIFLTKSKTGLLALSLLMMLWLFSAKSNSFIKRVLIIIGSIIVISVFIVPAHHWKNMYDTIIAGVFHQKGSMGSRYEYWHAAYLAFKSSPICGIGIGQFPWYTFKYSFIGPNDLGTVMHNSYLTILTENGIIGLSLYLGWIFIAVYRYWTVFRKGTSEDLRVRGFSGLCAFAMILFMSITLSIEYFKLLWILGGTSIALAIEQDTMEKCMSHQAVNITNQLELMPNRQWIGNKVNSVE